MSKRLMVGVACVAILALMLPALASDLIHREIGARPAVTKGKGVWLFKGAPAPGPQNAVVKSTAVRAGYSWTPAVPKAGAPSILIYTDDPTNPAPNTQLDQALQWWGLPYTAIYNGAFSAFETALAGQAWDIVIFANDNNGPPASTFTALQNYLLGGGTLYLHSWRAQDYAALLANMGASAVALDSSPPDPIYKWDPSHPIFTDPEAVPNFTAYASVMYGVYGQYLSVQPGAAAIAGYSPAPAPNAAVLILGNGGRSIFRGCMDAQLGIDQDGDGMLDGVELWINTLAYLLSGSYDMIFVDDYGRAQLCINSSTGNYVYHVFTEAGFGEYSGQGGFGPYRYGFYFFSSPEDPWQIYLNVALSIDRATGYMKWPEQGINSVIYDVNITDDPTSCD
jgi:hypothetical protein